ncbi:MAG: hypothetical protein MOGMAGMI_01829 [Candidatus Omnitrophica bacterium]|nr:hypothetical protein [Candidatus Omnitrophota bacterium]
MKIKKGTIITFLDCLGKTNLGDGYIDSIIYALLKIIDQNEVV